MHFMGQAHARRSQINQGGLSMIRTTMIVCAAMAFATSAHAGKCSVSSASGLGVTKDIATFMSNKALKDMTTKNGEKGVGKVSTTCDGSMVISTTCISKQRTCK
jgi:hypothetical protein